VDHEEDFSEFLQRVNREVLETFQYQTYPLELVFDELKMQFPDIPVSFNMVNINPNIDTQGNPDEEETIEFYHEENTQDVKFDLTLHATEFDNGIRMAWTYKKARFKQRTIETIVKGYLKLLDYITIQTPEGL
jgi:surfactin family lipopeptide synthetase A/lichenysin synthetase A